MLKNLFVYFSLLATLALAGCASVVDGGKQNINIMTSTGTPVTLKVTDVDGIRTVTAPSIVTVTRSSNDLIILVEDKCYTGEYVSEKNINLWTLGNVLIPLGTFSTSTDASTGALWAYDKTIVVPVSKKQGAGC